MPGTLGDVFAGGRGGGAAIQHVLPGRRRRLRFLAAPAHPNRRRLRPVGHVQPFHEAQPDVDQGVPTPIRATSAYVAVIALNAAKAALPQNSLHHVPPRREHRVSDDQERRDREQEARSRSGWRPWGFGRTEFGAR